MKDIAYIYAAVAKKAENGIIILEAAIGLILARIKKNY